MIICLFLSLLLPSDLDLDFDLWESLSLSLSLPFGSDLDEDFDLRWEEEVRIVWLDEEDLWKATPVSDIFDQKTLASTDPTTEACASLRVMERGEVRKERANTLSDQSDRNETYIWVEPFVALPETPDSNIVKGGWLLYVDEVIVCGCTYICVQRTDDNSYVSGNIGMVIVWFCRLHEFNAMKEKVPK